MQSTIQIHADMALHADSINGVCVCVCVNKKKKTNSKYSFERDDIEWGTFALKRVFVRKTNLVRLWCALLYSGWR